MKIDQVYFERFKKTLEQHPDLKKLVESGEVSKAEEYLVNKVFGKPEEYFTLKILKKLYRLIVSLALLIFFFMDLDIQIKLNPKKNS